MLLNYCKNLLALGDLLLPRIGDVPIDEVRLPVEPVIVLAK